MVRHSLLALVGLTASGLLLFCVCRPVRNLPPAMARGAVADTDTLIARFPSPDTVHVSKNGYRVFDLDAIADDLDNEDAEISWSFSPGPLMYARLVGRRVEIGPLANQVPADGYVVFTATDPGGLSVTNTCHFLVDTFKITLDTVTLARNSARSVKVGYVYLPTLKARLDWKVEYFDSQLLETCSLSGGEAKTITLKARGTTGITGVYLTVKDPVNHVAFSHSILVTIE